jgi:dihydroneopterin aldolase
MFEVFVKDLEFYAYHGVTSEERTVGHRFKVTVTVGVDGKADSTDSIGDTVDYGEIADAALWVGTQQQFHTVERLAGATADEIFKRFSSVRDCTIEISKQTPPFPAVAGQAGAIVKRKRTS